jgi:hypothetical protein
MGKIWRNRPGGLCMAIGLLMTFITPLWIASPAAAGGITGRATNSSGTGIGGIEVNAYNSSGDVEQSTVSQSNGNYAMTGLPAGGYRIESNGGATGYVNQWYNNKDSIHTANAVTVTADATTSGINAVLVLGGTVSGRVTNSSGSGIAGIGVHAFDSSGNYVRSGDSQPDGNYTIVGLPAGNCKILFDGSDSGYAIQWYNNKTTIDAANGVPVTAGAVTSGINAVLAQGGTITGRVTNSSGTGLANVWVDAYDAAGIFVNGRNTQSDGNYTIKGLPAGSYKIQFYGGSAGYLTEWYNNKATIGAANAVSVTAGVTTSGINAVLVQGGGITGRVTNPSGAGIAGVWVEAYNTSGAYVNGGYTQSDGNYAIADLAAGSYKIQFFGGNLGYLAQWYSNKTSFDDADAVPVATGSVTSGINALMQPASPPVLNLSFAGTGSGTVTSNPAGIATNTAVSHEFDFGTVVTLNAAAEQYSLFAGWTGACSGTGNCVVTMDGGKTVTATFNRNTAQQARINPTYYASIMGAYLAASSGNTIQIWGVDFSESFIFNQNKAVTLEGGYNGGYTDQSGYTTLIGPLTISQGGLTVDRLVVK